MSALDAYIHEMKSESDMGPGLPIYALDWYTDATKDNDHYLLFRNWVEMDSVKIDYVKNTISFTIPEIGENFVEQYFIELGAPENWGVALSTNDRTSGALVAIRAFTGVQVVEHTFGMRNMRSLAVADIGGIHTMTLGFESSALVDLTPSTPPVIDAAAMAAAFGAAPVASASVVSTQAVGSA